MPGSILKFYIDAHGPIDKFFLSIVLTLVTRINFVKKKHIIYLCIHIKYKIDIPYYYNILK